MMHAELFDLVLALGVEGQMQSSGIKALRVKEEQEANIQYNKMVRTASHRRKCEFVAYSYIDVARCSFPCTVSTSWAET